MAESGFIRILDELDYAMYGLFMEYVDGSEQIMWEGLASGANHGQQALYEMHMSKEMTEHFRAAKELWPEGEEPYGFIDRMYSCYNPNVISRTWSDTIDQILDHMMECWEEASELQRAHEDICEIIHANPPPHSTATDWRGSPV